MDLVGCKRKDNMKKDGQRCVVLGRGGGGYYQGSLYISVKLPRGKLKYFLKRKAGHDDTDL